MGTVVVEERESRVIDTFAARELHELQRMSSIDLFRDYGIRAGYSWSSTQKGREKEDEI